MRLCYIWKRSRCEKIEEEEEEEEEEEKEEEEEEKKEEEGVGGLVRAAYRWEKANSCYQFCFKGRVADETVLTFPCLCCVSCLRWVCLVILSFPVLRFIVNAEFPAWDIVFLPVLSFADDLDMLTFLGCTM